MEALTPNWTVLIHIGIFAMVYFVLKAFLFEPYLDALERRHAAAGGAAEALDDERAALDAIDAKIDAELKAARERGHAAAENILAAATASAEAAIAAASAEAEAKIRNATAEIEAAEAKIRSTWMQDVDALAQHAAERLLEDAA